MTIWNLLMKYQKRKVFTYGRIKMAFNSIAYSILMSIVLISCGRFEKNKSKETKENPNLSLLQTKNDLYLQLIQPKLDESGFILHEDCDSLLFTGLLSSAQSINTDITAARDPNGQWFRRPLSKPCSSASTISRDMLIGVMWYAWRNNRLDIAEDLFEYGRSHTWIMGEGDKSRTIFTPNMQSTLARLIFKMGGASYVERNIPMSWASNLDGFEAHLQTLLIALHGEMYGQISGEMLSKVAALRQNNPNNALFSYIYSKYTTGDQSEAVNILLNKSLFPEKSLPTNANYCTEYLWQRDQLDAETTSSDWLPCDKTKEHTGVDFLFVSGLILGR